MAGRASYPSRRLRPAFAPAPGPRPAAPAQTSEEAFFRTKVAGLVLDRVGHRVEGERLAVAALQDALEAALVTGVLLRLGRCRQAPLASSLLPTEATASPPRYLRLTQYCSTPAALPAVSALMPGRDRPGTPGMPAKAAGLAGRAGGLGGGQDLLDTLGVDGGGGGGQRQQRRADEDAQGHVVLLGGRASGRPGRSSLVAVRLRRRQGARIRTMTSRMVQGRHLGAELPPIPIRGSTMRPASALTPLPSPCRWSCWRRAAPSPPATPPPRPRPRHPPPRPPSRSRPSPSASTPGSTPSTRSSCSSARSSSRSRAARN